MTRRWISALLMTALALAAWRASEALAAAPASVTAAGATMAAVPGGGSQPGPGPAAPRQAARNDSYCLTCHGTPGLTTRAASGRMISLYVDSRVLRDSAHSQLDCVTCHAGLDNHPDQPAATGAVDEAAASVVMCESCHQAAASGYGESVHGAPVLAGTGTGATCIDCHATDDTGHATTRITGVAPAREAELVAENCGRCHASELGTYRVTAHSQLVRFGAGDRAATCTTCHGAHAIVAAGSGALTPARLATVCRQCHTGADARFAQAWRGHEASAAPAGLADGLHRGVVALMALCLAFGVAHTTLDFVRRPRRLRGGRDD